MTPEFEIRIHESHRSLAKNAEFAFITEKAMQGE
jgi:hypothetical protein